MILNPYELRVAYGKTDGKCAICGREDCVICTGFIPRWTRVRFSLDNVIPLCDECRLARSFNFIELGKLTYLNRTYVEQLMRFYRGESKYLKIYTRKFGSYRTGGLLDVDYSLSVLNSYDEYIRMHQSDLDWESMR